MTKTHYIVCYEYLDDKNKVHTKVEKMLVGTIPEIYYNLEIKYNRVKILSIIRS